MENRRFLQRFYSAPTGFHRIADWRVGGESTHKSASFLYTSFVGRINIQMLNYSEIFHFIGEGQAIRGVRGWPAIAQAIHGHQAIHGWPRTDCHASLRTRLLAKSPTHLHTSFKARFWLNCLCIFMLLPRWMSSPQRHRAPRNMNEQHSITQNPTQDG